MVAILFGGILVVYNVSNPFGDGRAWGFFVGTMTVIIIDAVTSDKYGF